MRSADNLGFMLDYSTLLWPRKRSAFDICITIPEGAGPVVLAPAAEAARWPGSTIMKMGAIQYMLEDRFNRELALLVLSTFQVGNWLSRACGAALPPMRVAGVVVPRLPWREGEPLLLTRRASRGVAGTFNLMWVFPGGATGASEAPIAAAARELKEETGLVVRPEKMRLLGAFQAESKFINSLMLIFAGDAEEGPVAFEPKEVSQAAFLPRADAVRLLAGERDGFLDGFECGAGEGEVTERRVPLAELEVAKFSDRDVPGLGAAHWFALERFFATEDSRAAPHT
eukprot:NODE_1369_length_1164_cov_228.071235.p1 GENE.NODE_1369_length_1164_cov_228.071235~~NODE_1369_length_1164_cov_228.071235.p1  ORF type:complete len:285 (+),score=80.29 NODE_1369_length_1164_cov_228.071235:137-991(+)